jgi:hypothetical protein
MRGKAYRFHECMRDVKGATRSQYSQLRERDIFRVMSFQVFPDLRYHETIFPGGQNLPAGLNVLFKNMPDSRDQK